MIRCLLLWCTLLPAIPAWGQSAPAAIDGIVTDPSGRLVPGAQVRLIGPSGEQRKMTDAAGRYAFPGLRPGKYRLLVARSGFAVAERRDLEINGAMQLDIALNLAPEKEVMDVAAQSNSLTTEPDANGDALILGEKELDVLSDDPDELLQQLQAMAGPGAGPNGGQVYIDGFTGGQMPPKSSIREVRINANPFSSEYEHPGFGRIEIFTRPGTDKLRAQVSYQYNKEALNSRSPLLAQSQRPPYRQQLISLGIGTPIQRDKSSLTLDFQRRSTNENAFILASTLDNSLNPTTVNQAVLTPQSLTSVTPKFNYSINTRNTLVLRYQYFDRSSQGQGIGGFNLASRGHNQSVTEHNVQVTETKVVSTRWVNELRFQWQHDNTSNQAANTLPAIVVQGAFSGGGPQVGNSGDVADRLELADISTYTWRSHILKWGFRARQSHLDDTSVTNFGGTFVFRGRNAPLLGADNTPLGSSIEISALESYRRTLVLLGQGFSPAQVRQLGGGATEFSLSGGAPLASVSQYDAGLFFSDDWKLRPRLTLSLGLRYEAQTHLRGDGVWAPRLGLAWGLDGAGARAPKTVLRAGIGVFYDRISSDVTLQAQRYNGFTQQSYLILNPDFFPVVPTLSQLQASGEPQRLVIADSALVPPRSYPARIGIDRQINKSARISMNYIISRGVHLERSRDINAPVAGVFPYGDRQLRMLTETSASSRSGTFTISPFINYKRYFLFGFYALSHGRTDAEGQPADPYNLRAEWGPSTYWDVRHRLVLGGGVPTPGRITLTPFIVVASGTPYNITTGLDTNGDGIAAERPALVAGASGTSCVGANLVFETRYGCLNLNPSPGAPVIGRNIGRGPGTVVTILRLARTWPLGQKKERNPDRPTGGSGGSSLGAAASAIGVPSSVFGSGSRGKYNLTLSVFILNPLNHPNYAPPEGDLSSPYFGQYRSLGGLVGSTGTYNRKIDVQLRFWF